MEINTHISDKLLIVGGNGFIGRHVVKKALKEKFNITVLTKNSSKALHELDSVSYIYADIADSVSLLAQLKGRTFDYVINLGGYVNHANYSSGGKEVYDVHFNGVRNLVNTLKSSELKNFIQIGSSDEYGNNPAPQFETQREAPISVYSSAKVASTHFLQTLYKTEKFPSVILRPFLVYGPGQGEERFIPQIIKGCLNNQKFPTSNGEQLRDFCFIDDFVEAIFSVLGNVKVLGEVINISSGNAVSIKQVVEMIVDIIGTGRPQFGLVDYRIGENMALYANIDKAITLLDWKPNFLLERGLIETIESVKNTVHE